MIAQLLSIKQLRADKAQQAVARQTRILAKANRDQEIAKKKAEEYRIWRIDEEERLFEQAKKTCLTLKELESLQQHIAILRDKEAALDEDVAKALHRCEQEREQLKTRKEEARQAEKAVEKFLELNQQELAEQTFLKNYREELEQEEFRAQPLLEAL